MKYQYLVVETIIGMSDRFQIYFSPEERLFKTEKLQMSEELMPLNKRGKFLIIQKMLVYRRDLSGSGMYHTISAFNSYYQLLKNFLNERKA